MSVNDDLGLLARIIEHTPIGIAILSPSREIRYVNLCAARMFDCERDSIIGTSFDMYCPGCLEKKWPRLLEGGTIETEARLSRPGGNISCSLTAFFIGNKESRMDAAAIILRDISDEIKIAEQLEKKNIEMAKMNTELIHSNIELKRLSEKKSDFLSIASHELKTPLTSIMGYSDLIVDGMKDRVDSGVYRMIESINRAAGRLNNVINNILDITRIEQKRLRLKPETFDLAAVASECAEEFLPVAAKRAVALTCNCAAGLPKFFGDRMRMHQVFTNLISNAIKFSPDGAAVEVSLALENGDRFHLAVKDRGIGISTDEQKHIFDPFSELGEVSKHTSSPMKFKGGGIGLGLSITKGIVERHGGRIWVESEGAGERLGEFPGSTFHVVLPLRAEIEWDDLEKTAGPPFAGKVLAHKAPAGTVDTGVERPSVLVIDTDPETVEVTRMVLENAFEVVSASNAEKGFQLAFERRPSVILLNSSITGLDGLRICKILRSQEETRTTPIVFLSKAAPGDEIERCFSAGANDFIVKPFSGRELIDKMWQLMLNKKTEMYPVVR